VRKKGGVTKTSAGKRPGSFGSEKKEIPKKNEQPRRNDREKGKGN